MARLTVAEKVGTAAVARRRGPALWRLVPLAFYLLAFTLVRSDLARLPGGVADLSLHLYFAAMGLYVGGMFFYFAFFAYRTEALRWVAIALVARAPRFTWPPSSSAALPTDTTPWPTCMSTARCWPWSRSLSSC